AEGAEEVDRELVQALVGEAPVDLRRRDVGARQLAVEDVREHTVAVEPQDFHVNVRAGDALAEGPVGDTGGAVARATSRDLEQVVEGLFVADVEAQRDRAALEAERVLGDVPATIELAQDILARDADVVEEDLVEAGLAG